MCENLTKDDISISSMVSVINLGELRMASSAAPQQRRYPFPPPPKKASEGSEVDFGGLMYTVEKLNHRFGTCTLIRGDLRVQAPMSAITVIA